MYELSTEWLRDEPWDKKRDDQLRINTSADKQL